MTEVRQGRDADVPARAESRESDPELSLLMENATEGLIVADDQGQVLYWNPSAVAMFGYTSTEEGRRHLSAFVDTFEVRPLNEERILTVEEWPMSRMLRGEPLRDWRVRLRRIDQGWEKIFSYSGWFSHSVHGERRTIVSITDMTDAHQAIDSVSTRDTFIAGVLGSITDGLFTVDTDWRFTFVNDEFCRRTGKRRDELLDHRMWELFSEAETMEVRREYQRAMDERVLVDLEVYYPPFQKWFATRLYPNSDGGLVVYSKDVTARKQAEGALRLATERFQQAFHGSPAALSITRVADGRFIDVNAAYLRMIEYSRDEVVGHTSLELGLLSAPARERVTAQLVATGEVHDCKLRLQRKSGRPLDVLFSSHGMELEGEPTYITTMLDITLREQAERELRESEERLRLSTALANVAVWEFDFLTGQMSRSTNHDRLYGLSPQPRWEMDTFVQATHPDDRARSLGVIQQSAAPGGPDKYAFDFRVVYPDQSVHWLAVIGEVVERSDTGHGQLVRGCLSDITERKEATEERTRLAMAVQQSADTILITDPDGTIRYANPAFETTSGYTRAEAIGQNPRLLKSGVHDADFYGAMWDTLARGETWVGHLTNRRKDGTLYEEAASISPVRNTEGTTVNYVAVKRDITEQKRLELQMLRSQRLEGIGTLASGIAHDLNNVLAPIMMSNELLQVQYPAESETLDMIAASTKRAADMVRQLLAFAKGAKGEHVSIHPARVVKEINKLLSSTLPKNIMLKVTSEAELATVRADATQLHQVLLNLCVNARDAMPTGGTLSVEATNRDVDKAFADTVADATPGAYVALRVRDTGTGMSPEVLDRMFDPFFTTKTPDKGTGLGLSTVLGIVKGHGGFLHVESRLGQGSTLTVYLPAEARESYATPERTVATVFRGRGELILFVDDERAIRETASAILRRLNVTPLTATDGADALIQAGQHRAELRAVITDMHMPTLDGLALIRALREMFPNLPIAVVSGRTDGELAEEFTAAGVTSQLEKPFTEAQLADLLGTLLATR